MDNPKGNRYFFYIGYASKQLLQILITQPQK